MPPRSATSKIHITELKRNSRKIVKTHYLFLLITCMFSAFLGSEFNGALAIFHSQTNFFTEIVHLPSALAQEGQSIFGHSRGIFASLISNFGSNSLNNTLFNGINSIIGSEGVSIVIFVLLSLLFKFALWFFLGNVFIVMSRRVFLESRIYKTVSPKKFLFLFYIKKWTKVSLVMFVKYIYNMLWYGLFFIGGVVKHYSYFLVPFILAENPDLTAKQAITLSRRMMNGHKWKCFLLDFSFLGWFLLRIATFGLSGLFYTNAYQVAAYTEFYAQLRTFAKEKQIPGAELLNDRYLYEKADEAIIENNYSDILSVLNAPITPTAPPKNKPEAILNFFGIALHRTKNDEARELEIIRESNAREEFKDIIQCKQYPTRLFTLPEHPKKSKSETSNYMRKYTIPTLIMMFFIFCLIGWIWEVSLYFVQGAGFVNRGTMYGPWLPIYGTGGVLILTLLYKLRKKVLVQFFAAVLLCGTVEYMAAYSLEMMHNGTKWWDYSGYFINFQGRVCGEGLLVFGLGAIAVVYLLAPVLDDYINKIKPKLLLSICCVLLVLFTIDALYSSQHPNAGDGITSSDINITAVDNSDISSLFLVHHYD